MKKTSERLKIVLTLAKLREKLAAEKLAETIRQAQLQRDQVSQLRSFQQEYKNQFIETGSKGASPLQLKNFQSFFKNLELAVESQQLQLSNSESNQEQARDNWRYHYSKQKNMEKLIEKKVLYENQEVEKRLQSEQDDRKLYKPIG